ncbi:YjbF family lipoprotein [Rhodalgimonas zhirmunskyi]|uniref:YjbF family lipoprotein n=1 Tax=Rhodalgimonas zhirmunskyi TaxID=2964767 RepID=A0AAJ1U905_9RHOB|nr:YjbF family lipoprotein [Rhodoalgimonas zhirmunskyi]MDQ2094005.1 YjbF family lipoprotein [Rhodoalgimonas zhirmunskyi]
MKRMMRWGAAALAAMVLVSCGNQPDRGLAMKAVSTNVFKKGGQSKSAPSQQLQAVVAQALSSTDLPLAIGVVEGRNATAILTKIESNGAYDTWATPDRRSLVLKRGLVTATRGLGNDIMSSDLGGVSGLIASRKNGTGPRVMRYLDGENHTIELVMQCSVTRGGEKTLSAGEIRNRKVTEMRESCTAEGRSFTNTYLVDRSGVPVQSRQWFNPKDGYITIQMLR